MTGDLKTPGELLQEARKARGLSIPDLSAKTKIPERMLEAIELDDYQKVSGALYVKSFLRTYAQYVGLNPQEILDLYQRQPGAVEAATDASLAQSQTDIQIPLQPQQSVTPQTIGKPPLEEEAAGGDVWKEDVQIRRIGISRRSRFLLWLGLVAALVVVVFLVSKGLRREDGGGDQQDAAQSTDPLSEQAPAVSQEPLTTTFTTEDTEEVIPAMAQVETDSLVSDPVINEPATTPVEQTAAEPAPRDLQMGLPRALTGDSTLVFAGGRQANQVVRVICDEPQAIEVQWFGIRRPLTAVWAMDPAPLPARGIEAGRGYRVAEGLVVYWGSDYDIEIKLPTTRGLSVTLNGESVSLDEAAVGRWRLLNPSVVGQQ